MIWQRQKELYSCRDHKYKVTVSINSTQSSLKSHSLWVTLYLLYKNDKEKRSINIFKIRNFQSDTILFYLFYLFYLQEDEESFKTFAVYCGLALHHAKLYDKIRRSEQKYKVSNLTIFNAKHANPFFLKTCLLFNHLFLRYCKRSVSLVSKHTKIPIPDSR